MLRTLKGPLGIPKDPHRLLLKDQCCHIYYWEKNVNFFFYCFSIVSQIKCCNAIGYLLLTLGSGLITLVEKRFPQVQMVVFQVDSSFHLQLYFYRLGSTRFYQFIFCHNAAIESARHESLGGMSPVPLERTLQSSATFSFFFFKCQTDSTVVCASPKPPPPQNLLRRLFALPTPTSVSISHVG